MPTSLVQLGPLSIQTEGPNQQINRAGFEADQALGQSYLDKVPEPDSDRQLAWQAGRMSLQDRNAFREAGNQALVSYNTIITSK